MVSTRRAVRRQSTFGTPRLASPAKFSASSAAAAPSRDRFISTVTASAKTSTDSTRRKRRQPRARALHRAGETEKQLEIVPERALDAGPQHLDRDRTPVRGDRIVDLGDGSRGDGAIVERVEQRLHRRAELDGDRRSRLFRRKGRQAIAKPRQIGGCSRADQIGPGGKRLTQFDETGAQRHSGVGERLPETLFGRAAPRQQPHRARQPRRRRADSFERRKRIVPRQNARDPRQTPEIEKRAGHQTRQPQCNRTIPPHSDRDRAPAKPARTSAADNTSGGGKRRMLSARYS